MGVICVRIRQRLPGLAVQVAGGGIVTIALAVGSAHAGQPVQHVVAVIQRFAGDSILDRANVAVGIVAVGQVLAGYRWRLAGEAAGALQAPALRVPEVVGVAGLDPVAQRPFQQPARLVILCLRGVADPVFRIHLGHPSLGIVDGGNKFSIRVGHACQQVGAVVGPARGVCAHPGDRDDFGHQPSAAVVHPGAAAAGIHHPRPATFTGVAVCGAIIGVGNGPGGSHSHRAVAVGFSGQTVERIVGQVGLAAARIRLPGQVAQRIVGVAPIAHVRVVLAQFAPRQVVAQAGGSGPVGG